MRSTFSVLRLAFVVGDHNKPCVGVLGSNVAKVEREVEVERIVARARDGHQGRALTDQGLEGLTQLLLVRPMEDPGIREARGQVFQKCCRRLHIFEVNQHMDQARHSALFRDFSCSGTAGWPLYANCRGSVPGASTGLRSLPPRSSWAGSTTPPSNGDQPPSVFPLRKTRPAP